MTEAQIRDILVKLNREHLEVMCGVAQGQSYREIGAHLNLSPSTVKRRVNNVMVALGAENSVHAAAKLVEAGLISSHDDFDP